jgi:hypothetical protein
LKRNAVFILSLTIFSLLDGYLLSAISFVGRAGISLFYTEYQFLKSWWKGAILVFVVWMILFAIQSYLKRKSGNKKSNLISVVMILIAVAGLFFSYSDFRNSLSHRWLGERFHLGVYLFWLGCIVISIVVLMKKAVVVEANATMESEVNSRAGEHKS